MKFVRRFSGYHNELSSVLALTDRDCSLHTWLPHHGYSLLCVVRT